MTEDVSRPFLVGGERMKLEAGTPRRGGPKTHRFSYAQVRDRLLPQVSALRSQATQSPALRTSEFVFGATLWPEYLAASYFPEELIEEAGLDLVGSQPAQREKVTANNVQPDALTKDSIPLRLGRGLSPPRGHHRLRSTRGERGG